jgi:hypothetical protein
MLKQAGYGLQSNRKTKEGGSHPDRNAQFEYINGSVEQFQRLSRSNNAPSFARDLRTTAHTPKKWTLLAETKAKLGVG